MLAVIRMLLDGNTTSREAATACRANGIFRENFRQCFRELAIKSRNVWAATHDPMSKSIVRDSLSKGQYAQGFDG
jgi:hypothetical protein